MPASAHMARRPDGSNGSVAAHSAQVGCMLKRILLLEKPFGEGAIRQVHGWPAHRHALQE
jgi:hypothetical protein